MAVDARVKAALTATLDRIRPPYLRAWDALLERELIVRNSCGAPLAG
jgi:hypothetical protein